MGPDAPSASAGPAAASSEEVAELDLTTKPSETETSPGLVSLKTVPYDPSPDREKKRGTIAIILVVILLGIVALSFIYVFILLFFCENGQKMEVLKELLQIVFAPLVGLVGAVTGFYFGEKSK